MGEKVFLSWEVMWLLFFKILQKFSCFKLQQGSYFLLKLGCLNILCNFKIKLNLKVKYFISFYKVLYASLCLYLYKYVNKYKIKTDYLYFTRCSVFTHSSVTQPVITHAWNSLHSYYVPRTVGLRWYRKQISEPKYRKCPEVQSAESKSQDCFQVRLEELVM